MSLHIQQLPSTKSFISFVSLTVFDSELDLTVFSETPFVVIQVQENEQALEGTSLFLEVCIDQTNAVYGQDEINKLESALIQKYASLKDFVRNNAVSASVLNDIEKQLNTELTEYLGYSELVAKLEEHAVAAHASFVNAMKGQN